MSGDWRDGILQAAREALNEPGAVVVRLTTQGSEAVSRVYRASDYDSSTTLRRVAVSRATRLLNQDQGGWNYYSVIRYPGGELVAWTGMHSILAETSY